MRKTKIILYIPIIFILMCVLPVNSQVEHEKYIIFLDENTHLYLYAQHIDDGYHISLKIGKGNEKKYVDSFVIKGEDIDISTETKGFCSDRVCKDKLILNLHTEKEIQKSIVYEFS